MELEKYPWKGFEPKTNWVSYIAFTITQLAFITAVLWYARSSLILQAILVTLFVFSQYFGKKKKA